MDCDKMHKPQKNFGLSCKMEGAIMMSNRATKQECLAKKVFGLPHNMINFTERIKAGMLLFLFEHEERKLYGVFEATTDGAMNIMPNAFLSQGKLFPAQVLFRRVWMCRPLCEDEFCHAIIDNYYSPKKFNFDLSYNQVFQLVQLFYVRRINVKQNLNYVPNKIIRMFQEDFSNNCKSSMHFMKALNPRLTDHEFQLHPKASQDASINGGVSTCLAYDHHSHASSLEISPLSEDPLSNADSSNAADVSFERYDPTNPVGTFNQKSENVKEIISSPSHYICYDNTRNDKSYINASKHVVYDESEEYYPSIIEPKFRSDVEVKRTSVFSRLSIDPNAAMKRKSFSGSNNLIMMPESSKQSKKLERSTCRRSSSMFPTEKSLIDDSTAEARRSFKKTKETEMNIYTVDDGTLYNHKKLELLSIEERNRPEHGSNHAETETKVVPNKESDNISVCLKNSLPSECSLGMVASNDTEKCSGSHKKEIRSKNLLWFLQKSKDVKTSTQ